MKPTIFIDGREGTTGLQIDERLAGRRDITLLTIDPDRRKDTAARTECLNAADLVFLCLPDAAAREAVTLIRNPSTRVIDASTAHRTADGWTYGFPELSPAHRAAIAAAKRVSNPGCHATGTIALLAPLVAAGLIASDCPLSITSVTGYTGGGKGMIAEYEAVDRAENWELNAPRAYALGLQHKHIPEIMRHAGLNRTPAFLPVVAGYPQGMQVLIPIPMQGVRTVLLDALCRHYENCPNVDVWGDGPAFATSNVNADTDRLTLRVLGSIDIALLTAQLDNLGKGAAGAAVQNMNLMLGFDEMEGLLL